MSCQRSRAVRIRIGKFAAALPQRADQVHAGQLGQAQINDSEVNRKLLTKVEAFLPVAGCVNDKALAAKASDQRLTQFCFVFNDKNSHQFRSEIPAAGGINAYRKNPSIRCEDTDVVDRLPVVAARRGLDDATARLASYASHRFVETDPLTCVGCELRSDWRHDAPSGRRRGQVPRGRPRPGSQAGLTEEEANDKGGFQFH